MSGFDEIDTAVVIRYPYLWNREASHGETEGRKGRAVVGGVRLAWADGDLVLLFPITTKHPEAHRFAFEIPSMEKRRAGLMPICGSESFWMSITAMAARTCSCGARRTSGPRTSDRLDRQSRCSIATGPMSWGRTQLRRSFDLVQAIFYAEKDLATGPIALGWRQSLPYLRLE